MTERLNLNHNYHPGFGFIVVKKDGEDALIQYYDDNKRLAMRAENLARKDPEHDWRFEIKGPLNDAVFKRHGKNRWVLIK